jgi:hypothetical protein
MNTLLSLVYLGELQQQAEYALNAVQQVNRATRQLRSPSIGGADRSGAVAEAFRGIHSFLAHASNMSKLLWPALPRRRTKETEERYRTRLAGVPKLRRGSHLRVLLGLDETDHPLRSRQLRDHLEHFDERLDTWSETSVDHDFVRAHIGPESEISHLAPEDRLRSFDPSTTVFCFRGERFELAAMVAHIEDLKQRAAIVSYRLSTGTRGKEPRR